ncbi:MAG TPA: metal ABC transporter permease [Clostridia bacterium]|nr:metal ABC transporter permease [Clostridia bacterium]
MTLIIEMFSYSFMVRGFIAGFIISLCAALLGAPLVLKRYSMIGDGLSHVSFGAMAVATAFNWAPLSLAIPIVILASIVLLNLSEKGGLRGDAFLGLISTGSMAIGVSAMSMTKGMNIDVTNYMFGSILSMTREDVYFSLILGAFILVSFILFYHEIFAVTFDESFARVSGRPYKTYKMLLAVLTAITIVLGMRMMGAMLISSLILFPAFSTMQVFGRFYQLIIFSALIGVTSFLIGMLLSYFYSMPTGASIVLVNMAFFILFYLIGKKKKS